MRIASLLPSATEIVYALGLGDRLVAVTHECDYPPEAASKPHVTRSLLPSGLPSAQIDRAVRVSQRDAHTIYALDAERLIELAPDVVLTQSLCEVCAVPRAAVDAAICSMPQEARIVSLDPHTLDEMLQSMLDAGESVGAPEQAQRVVDGLRCRLDVVRHACAFLAHRPRVLCLEWLDPPYCGGHWVPEQVRLAGGEDGLGREGQPSTTIEWAEVLRYRPEVIVLMPCGFDAIETAARSEELSRRPGWPELSAVQQGQVFAVNASAYFSRPGPRLVEGVELLARILHPEAIPNLAPQGAALKLVAAPAGGSTVENWTPRFEPYR